MRHQSKVIQIVDRMGCSRGRNMRSLSALLFVGYLLSGVATAQSPVVLTIDSTASGKPVPGDFVGLSFETGSLKYNSAGVNGYLFDSTNRQLLTLFRNLGVKDLRIGGTSVDKGDTGYIPDRKDIDALFRFAKAAHVQVIYSLRLFNGDPQKDASTARYVWNNYRKHLAAFAIGNEPNLYKGGDPEIKDEASFFVKWDKFDAVIGRAVPGANLGAPDNGTGGTTWAAYLVEHKAVVRDLTEVFSHYYVGGGTRGKSAQTLIDEMLSQRWDTVRYPDYYAKIGKLASSAGLPYRLTELNSFVAPFPGTWGGNNAFATALFVLDCMHWWAAHGSSGVNFHSVIGKYNATIYRDGHGDYQIYPMGYGIKAFDVGGHGREVPVAISNQSNLDVTAYAVTDAKGNLFVTAINKEHGEGARGASVTIHVMGAVRGKAAAMFLTAPDSDAAATNGITLGGAHITNNAPWRGTWTALNPGVEGHYAVTVPAASAAIIKVSAR